MTEGNSEAGLELEDILRRLEEARQGLMDAVQECDEDRFAVEAEDTESVKRALERTADDLDFYYGSLTARALTLPQPPGLQRADFSSMREAAMALQVAHRRFANLLHDVLPADLEKAASGDDHGAYTLRQVLEMATAQYSYRAQQVKRIAAQTAQRR